MTSGSDAASAKAARERVLKHLQDYKDTVLAFCGISSEVDLTLAGANKRAKTQSTKASVRKRKADGDTEPASGEQSNKKNRATSSGSVGKREVAKAPLKLGIYVSDSSIPTPDDIGPLRSFFDEKYKSQDIIKEKKVRDMLCNILWYGVKCITSSKFCNEHGTFVKGVRLTLPRGIKDKRIRMFKMLENAYVCVSVALANATDLLNGEALSAVLEETNVEALHATQIWLEFGESLKDSIKVYADSTIKEKALHVLKAKAQESIDFVRELKRDLLAASAADENAKKDDFLVINFPDECANGALTLLADAALRGDQQGNSIAVTSFLFLFLFFNL